MNAFEFIESVRRSGGSIDFINGKVRVRAFPYEVQVALLNREAVLEALANPERWACRKFQSHPVDPRLPCRTCREGWGAHPPDLRRPYDRAPLLVEAGAVVAAAAAANYVETGFPKANPPF